MEADLEALFVALKLGYDSIKSIAQAVSNSSVTDDLDRAACLVRRAADLIGQHIDDANNISIFRRD